MPATADSIYQLIKSIEGQFKVPAPFFIVNVGTFSATEGHFNGLTTSVDFDPEPLEHGPKQRPINPAPKFQGTEWVSITINAGWQRTITSTPAPKVPLAPVLLTFSIANATTPWSVTVNGTTYSAAANQSSITVNIWDAANVGWVIQCGAKSYKDNMKLQRPAGALGNAVGAFTIPIIPVSVIYAPPADSLNLSSASYGQGQTVGTTVTTDLGNDSSNTKPQYTDISNFKAGLDTIGEALGLAKGSEAEALAKVVGDISTQLGQTMNSVQTGISDLYESQITVTTTNTSSLSTVASGGGPGAGDVIHFYKNVRMAWTLLNGRLRLCPFGYSEAIYSAAGLKNNLSIIGISAADAQVLLSLDPFTSGGPSAQLPEDRFTFQQNWEYGFGTVFAQSLVVTRDTKTTDTTKTYTTTTSEYDAGPILQLFGFGSKTQTTTSLSNATGSDVSNSVTLNVNLVSGPNDHFVVNVWYDNLLGTFAFQQLQAAPKALFQGDGAKPGAQVTLTVGKSTFHTVADKAGKFAFHAPTIPQGSGRLSIGGQPAKNVMIGTLAARA